MTDALARASLELLAFLELSDDRTMIRTVRCGRQPICCQYAAVADALATEAMRDPALAGNQERAEFFRATTAELRDRADAGIP